MKQQLSFLVLIISLIMLTACSSEQGADAGSDATLPLPTATAFEINVATAEPTEVPAEEQAEEPTEEALDLTSLDAVMQAAYQAFSGGQVDDEALSALLAEDLSNCGYHAGCGPASRAEIITMLSERLPADGSMYAVAPGTDLVELLGQPPVADPSSAGTLLTSGWNHRDANIPQGAADIAFSFTQADDGTYRITSVIVVNGGFRNMNIGFELMRLRNTVVSALADHDYATLGTLIDGELWQVGQPAAMTPDVAVDWFQSTVLREGYQVRVVDEQVYNHVFQDWQTTTISDLLGYPVEDCCGSDVRVVVAVRISGWGFDGTQQAIMIFVEEPPGGVFRWYGYIQGPF